MNPPSKRTYPPTTARIELSMIPRARSISARVVVKGGAIRQTLRLPGNWTMLTSKPRLRHSPVIFCPLDLGRLPGAPVPDEFDSDKKPPAPDIADDFIATGKPPAIR